MHVFSVSLRRALSSGSKHPTFHPLLPIYPPPPTVLNSLSYSLPRRSVFQNPNYVLTTHLVPAAYLRATSPAPPPPAAAARTSSKEERRVRNAERSAWVSTQAEGPHTPHERVLWSAVNRYVRRDVSDGRGNGRTLFLAHANGFPKETWEPALLDFLAIPSSSVVDEIWAWEATHHGASFALNASTPLAACDWSDDARDVLNFLLHFLPSSITGPDVPLPVALLPVSPEENTMRMIGVFNERNLFAVGHSYGGCLCAWAALAYPRLFSALTLVDPPIMPFGTRSRPNNPSVLVDGAVARRDTWASRDDALTSFTENPFFATWDARALAAYVTHGLVPAQGDGVQLATPPLQEALVFAGETTNWPIWDMLPALDPHIPLRWVFPGRPGEPEFGEPGAREERVSRRTGNTSSVRIAGAGHLMVQEAPGEMAREIVAMIEG